MNRKDAAAIRIQRAWRDKLQEEEQLIEELASAVQQAKELAASVIQYHWRLSRRQQSVW